MDDSYIKEFEAEVISVTDDKYVVLDKTAFYPNGGGQPYDTGKILKDDEEFEVVYVGKFNNKISHEVDKPGLKPGDKIKGIINWERRYKLMRSHTAAHIISAVMHDMFNAKITGNQLSTEKIRIDFSLEDFDREKIMMAINKANEIIKSDLPVSISYMAREEALKDPSMVKLANAMPPAVSTLRIISIGDFDKQADGGTHVHSTKEVGMIELIKAENKGKNNRRVYLRLVD